VTLRQLSVNGFRNLEARTLEVCDGVTVIVGDNGAGKTSVLEAVAVLGNLVSFRPGPTASWVQRGAVGFALAGRLERGGTSVELRQEGRLARTLSRVLFRGARRSGAAEYMGLFPVATLSGHDRSLVWGPPEERRRYLDRLGFHLHADALSVLQRYGKALQHRNALLMRGADDELEAFEHELARLGARIVQTRVEVLGMIEEILPAELEALGWSSSRPGLRYDVRDGVAVGQTADLAARLRVALASARRRERGRGHTAVGPHRHDLAITVQGAPAKEALSAGQGKLLATALKLATLTLLERAYGNVPTVVFDDVDAELDATVLARVLARLGRGGQALLSSAHEEMVLPRLADAAVWRVVSGSIEVAASGGMTR
jgi:DNA replication and repair protein RecF